MRNPGCNFNIFRLFPGTTLRVVPGPKVRVGEGTELDVRGAVNSKKTGTLPHYVWPYE